MCHETENQNCISEELIKPLSRMFCLLSDLLADNVLAKMPGMLPDFETQNKKTAYELEAIKKQMDILGTNNKLLENANETNRLLGSHFYDEHIIQPMVRSLFPMVDFIDGAKEKFASDLPRYQLAIQYLTAIQSQLEQFLASYGIERFSHNTEKPFNPKIMKPLKIIFTNDANLNGLIAESLQCGFKMQERILRLETISLYKYQEQTNQNPCL